MVTADTSPMEIYKDCHPEQSKSSRSEFLRSRRIPRANQLWKGREPSTTQMPVITSIHFAQDDNARDRPG